MNNRSFGCFSCKRGVRLFDFLVVQVALFVKSRTIVRMCVSKSMVYDYSTFAGTSGFFVFDIKNSYA